MDDIFGEVVYIIIMLVIFIFSVLRKKKTERGNIPVPDDERSNPKDEEFSPFKEIFGDEEEPERSVSAEPVTVSEKRKDLKGAPFVKDDYVFTANTAPGDTRRKRRSKMPSQSGGPESKEDLNYKPDARADHSEWFDLRKAVIYSEMLKRPDY
jgi:hypothetical protein